MVSWKRLTLSEARGFITFYIIEYYPLAIENEGESLDVKRMDISPLSFNTTIDGLDEKLDYIVQVSASTIAGRGGRSSLRRPRVALLKDNTRVIVVGVVVVISILTIAFTAIIIAIVVVKRLGQKQNNTK